MAFIESHLISLICGVAALLAIVAGVLGMMRSNVTDDMKSRARISSQIAQLRSNAKNQRWIDAEKKRSEQFDTEYNETQTVARGINERTPLMQGVFPALASDPVAYDFRDEYKRAIQQLPRGELHGGGLPSQAEVEDAGEDVNELLERDREAREEGGDTAAAVDPTRDRSRRSGGGGRPGPAPVAGGVAPVVGGPRPVVGGPAVGGFGNPRLGGMSAGPALPSAAPDADPKYDPVARARVNKARSIRCYASPTSTFHISPIWDPAVKPTPAEMWYAQVGLWVQQDVVDAVAKLNQQAAADSQQGEAHVENMPVKRLQSVRVLGYWAEPTPIPFNLCAIESGGREASMEMRPSFTGKKCNDQYDVIRFKVQTVVDQRELLKLIDAITKQNFYQLIGLNYRVVKASDQDHQDGYLYGTAPVVRADMEFEGYMVRNVYEGLYPAEVRAALGIKDKK